jgi:hypothetical protein
MSGGRMPDHSVLVAAGGRAAGIFGLRDYGET